MTKSKSKFVTSHYEKRFERAIELRNSGDIDNALVILNELIRDDPEYHYSYIIIGDIYWDMKEIDKAINAFKKATILSPSSEKCSLCLFHVLWENEREEEALEEMKRFLKDYKSDEYNIILKEIVEKLNGKKEVADTKC
jgi:predicted Zn-dependent protease